MLPYAIVLLIPLLTGLVQSTRPLRKRPFFWLFFLLLVAFSGLRYEVGPDWTGYYYIFEGYLDTPLEDIYLISEPGFFLINKLSDALGFGLQGVIFFSAIIFLFGCFAYARTTASPWLALAAVMPYLIFVISMSGIRQAAAIGIGFFLFSRWSKSSAIEKLLLIGLAVSFHNSAVVFTLFLIFALKQGIVVRLLLSSAVVLGVVFGLDTTDTTERYREVYIEENLISGGAFFHVLLIAFPSALYLFYRDKLVAKGLGDRNVMLASVATLALMPMLLVSSTGVDRLTLYFSFVQMWVYPALLRSGVINKGLVRAGVAALVLAIFIVYFFFGTHASAYMPYKNVLFLL